MTAIRVYEYGLLPPHINAELVDQQMVKSHRYRNMLVEIDRERRDQVRKAMGAHPDLAPLEEQLRSLVEQRDKLREDILDHRRRTKSRSEPAEWRQQAKALGEQIKPLRDTVKTTRRAVAADATVKAAMEEAERHAKDRLKKARSECGVYWGTYLLQEQAADQARKEKAPPKFVRWRGEGRVSVQIQNGIPLTELWGEDTQIQIQPVHPDAWDRSGTTRRGVRRRLSRTVLRLRVGSEGAGNRRPIWAEWKMVMHRPIPTGAVIKLATVSRRRRDCVSWDWRLQLTVDVTACAATRPVPQSGAVALNLGFCQRGLGLIRSGFLVGDDGMEREILVTKSDDVRQMSRASEPGPVDQPVEGSQAPGAPGQNAVDGEHSPAVPGLDVNVRSSHAEHGHVDGADMTSHAERGVPCSHERGLTGASQEQPSDIGTGQYVQANSAADAEASESKQQANPTASSGLSRAVPNWILNGLAKADSIRSFRDKALDAMKALLCAWRAGNEIDGEAISDLIREWTKSRARPDAGTASEFSEHSPVQPGHRVAVEPATLPEWFVKGTDAVHAWRSAARFRRLAIEWKEQRFPGDGAMFTLVWAWRERDEHLERYESGLRRSALRDRREAYRIVAAQMAARYRYLIIDDTDLTQFQRSPATESSKVEFPQVKYNQRVAAGSELRNVMINAFGPARTIIQDHKDMTRRCHLCAHINTWDRVAYDRWHTCDRCGVRWDQDSNNCKNKLAEHRRAMESGDTAAGIKRKPSRADRFREARANRAA
jgi:hypothetical protein